MGLFKIMHTDNFTGDYPDEKFVTEIPSLRKEQAEILAHAINRAVDPSGSGMAPRHYKAVPEDYKLQPGFEP